MKVRFLWVFLALAATACKSFDKISSSDYEGKEFQTESGLKYTIHRSGDGERAAIGDIVQVHYSGRLLKDSTGFDDSYSRGNPFQFELGKGKVFGTTTGHNTFTYYDPLFRIILFRAMAWVINEKPDPFMPLVFDGITNDEDMVGTTDTMRNWKGKRRKSTAQIGPC